MTKRLIRREFLNKSGFHQQANAVLDMGEKYMNLHISDCQRTICLYGSLENKEQRENTLYKLRTLRDICDDGIRHIESIPEKAPRKRKPKTTEAAPAEEA